MPTSPTTPTIACRLLIDPPTAGAWNMAVDEALLTSAAEQSCPTLRFYRWSEPTLSLGYFQKVDERSLHSPSRGCPLVRRQTGGGAILHDRELTYSLALPTGVSSWGSAAALYCAVHEALGEALVRLHLTARLFGAADKPPNGPEPFLCFLRRSEADLVLGPTKICGSAQRRWRGALLQHGSLLLGRSDLAPELSGLLEQSGQRVDQDHLIEHWSAGIARRLDLALISGGLTDAELALVRSLAVEKYLGHRWNCRR